MNQNLVHSINWKNIDDFSTDNNKNSIVFENSWNLESIKNHLKKNHSSKLFYSIDHQIITCLLLYLECSSDEAEVLYITTHQNYRKQNLAKKMIERL